MAHPDGSALQKNVRMEQFQTAFVHALASVYGWRISKPDPDYDGIDLEISGTCAAISSAATLVVDPRISVQLKATSSLTMLQTGSISFDLEVKNYNKLIGNNYSTHRYLFVLDLPNELFNWCDFTPDHIILKNKCYWVSLKNEKPTKNTDSIAIHIPPNQIVSPKILNEMMYSAAKGKVYVQP